MRKFLTLIAISSSMVLLSACGTSDTELDTELDAELVADLETSQVTTIAEGELHPLVMEEIVIGEIKVDNDIVELLIINGYEEQDIWVTVNSETLISDQFDNYVDPTTFEVGDILSIYFLEVLESSPLQCTANAINIK